jgi:hypothetical protein
MPLAEFEPATPATKRPQTYALDRAATGIGIHFYTESFTQTRCHLKGFCLKGMFSHEFRTIHAGYSSFTSVATKKTTTFIK